MYIYRPQRSCGKVIFSQASVSHSVHRGGGVSQHTLGQTPPWTDIPPGETPPALCMLGYIPLPSAQCMLGHTPPQQPLLQMVHFLLESCHACRPSPRHACPIATHAPCPATHAMQPPATHAPPPWTEFLTHACENITLPCGR